MSDLHNLLLTVEVFKNFNAEELSILSRYLSVKQFVDGQVLMKKAEAGTYLCLILSGEADIIDENIVLATRSAGSVLGEMALIQSSPRMADVVAGCDGEIAIMSFESIKQFKVGHPEIAVKLVGILTESTMKKLNETAAALRAEKQRSEQLLLNVLPQSIVTKLKKEPQAIAEQFDEVTILFADIVDFTSLSTTMTAVELVSMLNKIFSTFDELAEHYGLEKIKTIGDAYMLAGGVPIARDDHAEAVARMALDMQEAMAHLNAENEKSLQIRIGINTGPGIAGVIGVKKFIYDLWGDAVNVAFRMESSGIPGRIHVTLETYKRLKNTFLFEERGEIEVKGKGEMMTYWLIGKK